MRYLTTSREVVYQELEHQLEPKERSRRRIFAGLCSDVRPVLKSSRLSAKVLVISDPGSEPIRTRDIGRCHAYES